MTTISFGRSKKIQLKILYFLWAIPTLTFAMNPSYESLCWQVSFAFIGTVLLVFKNTSLLTHALPFCALLSPLVLNQKFFGLYYSEVLILLMIIISVTQIKEFISNIKISPCNNLILSYIALLSVSYLLSGYWRPLIYGFFNGLIFVLVYFRCFFDIKNLSDIKQFFRTLLVASAYVSTLICVAFFSGLNLQNFVDPQFLITPAADVTTATALFNGVQSYEIKGSFFYTNIFFFNASALIILVFIFWRDTNSSRLTKLIFAFIGSIILTSLIVYFNKAILVAILLSFGIYICMSENNLTKRLLFLGGTVVILLLLLLAFIELNPQVTKLVGLSSLKVRLDLINSVTQVFLERPWHIFFGFGPESANRMSGGPDGWLFTMAKTTRAGTEGTIDSAFLGFLFEYGIIGLLILAVQIIKIGMILIAGLMDNKKSFVYRQWCLLFFCVFFCILLTGIVQVVGMSKVAWILGQIFACLSIFLSLGMHRDPKLVGAP